MCQSWRLNWYYSARQQRFPSSSSLSEFLRLLGYFYQALLLWDGRSYPQQMYSSAVLLVLPKANAFVIK
ncbi:MAG: hypothetical protein RIM23_22090 [Coleofasciculus sp. G3-WIS-01]|uniref:hypothetical protein n=1 Tax=Coleofasciculus sp. G3-WIS-01 TaxID=3069528 RepID=UPI0032F8293C